MSWLFCCIFSFIFLTSTSPSVFADELVLFSPEMSAPVPAQMTRGPGVIRQRIASINPDIFSIRENPETIELNLFEDARYKTVRQRCQEGVRGALSWKGSLVGVSGGKVVLMAKGQHISATVSLPNATYQVRPVDGSLHLIREVAKPVMPKLEAAKLPTVSDEYRLIELVNHERAIEGLTPLRPDVRLCNAAATHARDMARWNYYGHTRRDGRKFYQRIFEAGYPVSKCGENIAVGLSEPEEVFEGWINSPEHRAAILNPDFSEVGVGHAVNANSRFNHYWAQSFGEGREQHFRASPGRGSLPAQPLYMTTRIQD